MKQTVTKRKQTYKERMLVVYHSAGWHLYLHGKI